MGFFCGKRHVQLSKDFERKVRLVLIGYIQNLLFAFALHMEEHLSGSSVPLTAWWHAPYREPYAQGTGTCMSLHWDDPGTGLGQALHRDDSQQ